MAEQARTWWQRQADRAKSVVMALLLVVLGLSDGLVLHYFSLAIARNLLERNIVCTRKLITRLVAAVCTGGEVAASPQAGDAAVGFAGGGTL